MSKNLKQDTDNTIVDNLNDFIEPLSSMALPQLNLTKLVEMRKLHSSDEISNSSARSNPEETLSRISV